MYICIIPLISVRKNSLEQVTELELCWLKAADDQRTVEISLHMFIIPSEME